MFRLLVGIVALLLGGDAAPPTPPTKLTLRVRLPNGQTTRITAKPEDTVQDVRSKANGASDELFLDAACKEAVAAEAIVGSLGLENGAMLFCEAKKRTVAETKSEVVAAVSSGKFGKTKKKSSGGQTT